MYRFKLNALTIAAALVCSQAATAGTTIRIGVLTDMSGLYSDFSGAGSLEAAKMAAEDFMAANPEATMAAGIRAWKQVKRLNSPKSYRAFAQQVGRRGIS